MSRACFCLLMFFVLFGTVGADAQEECKKRYPNGLDVAVAEIDYRAQMDIMMVDANNMRTGRDATTGNRFEEIDCSGYGHEEVGSYDEETDEAIAQLVHQPRIFHCPLISAAYTVWVTTDKATSYYLNIDATDGRQHYSDFDFAGALSAGIRQEFRVMYDVNNAAALAVQPVLFDGIGQRPIDVNAFLAYAGPVETTTSLPSGTNGYDIAIYYGKTIDPTTFRAELEKQNVSASFHPKPGGAEVVRIPLRKSRNILELSVNGRRDDGKLAIDRDRLVFVMEK